MYPKMAVLFQALIPDTVEEAVQPSGASSWREESDTLETFSAERACGKNMPAQAGGCLNGNSQGPQEAWCPGLGQSREQEGHSKD